MTALKQSHEVCALPVPLSFVVSSVRFILSGEGCPLRFVSVSKSPGDTFAADE